MGNPTKVFNELEATGLNHAKVTIQLQSRGLHGQHTAVAETVAALNIFGCNFDFGKHLTNFKCVSDRIGDNYTITFEYDGFHNSQIFTNEVWKRLSPYFVLQNIS